MQTNGRGQRSPFQGGGATTLFRSETVCVERALFARTNISCSWMRCFVARGLPISRIADLMFEESPGINVEGREALHYLIQCMHKYGHKNRIGITLRRNVNHCDVSRGKIRCALRPACGTEHSSAPKKSPAGIQNLGTAGGATRNRNRRKRSTSRRRTPPKRRRSVQLVKIADCLHIEESGRGLELRL